MKGWECKLEWIKVEAGDYWSTDERFHILKVWDRIYDSHWKLLDRNANKEYSCDSLKDCKHRAIEIINQHN